MASPYVTYFRCKIGTSVPGRNLFTLGTCFSFKCVFGLVLLHACLIFQTSVTLNQPTTHAGHWELMGTKN